MNFELNPRETVGERYRRTKQERRQGNEAAGFAMTMIGLVFSLSSILGMLQDEVTAGRIILLFFSVLLCRFGYRLYLSASEGK